MRPKSAMIFAAGLGTRMQPLTDTTPKPMLKVAGRPLIDYALDLLKGQGISTIAVNTHYRPEQVEDHLRHHDAVTCIRETPKVLETGGGLRNALPVLGTDPVITLNSDVVFTQKNPVSSLLETWEPARMDALLALIPLEKTIEHTGVGDFFCDDTGRIIRRGDNAHAPYVYSSVQILKTDLLADIDEDVFSLNLLWDKIIAKGRAFGLVHPYPWVDVGRPTGLVAAEKALMDV